MAVEAEFPPYGTIPALTLHKSIQRNAVDASKIAKEWLTSLQRKFETGRFNDLSNLFIEDCWWRDILGLSWDFHSKHGIDAITEYLKSSKTSIQNVEVVSGGPLQPALQDLGGLLFVQTAFTFENKIGRGRGLLRLANIDATTWKAWTVYTQLERFHEQDQVDEHRIKESEIQRNITNHTSSNANKDDETLQVLVIGAGHSGLAIAAHLQHLDLRYRVLEKGKAPATAWSGRYQSIRSHTPTFGDHYPFLKFPENWPRWLDQDHIVRWMTHYQQILGLDVTFNTTVTEVTYDAEKRVYSANITQQNGTEQVLQCKHLVMATGLFSPDPVRPSFTDEDVFRGTVYHSSEHRTAAQIAGLKSKKVVIIGCATSALDVAQDFVAHGAQSVTVIQRHPIFVMSPDSTARYEGAPWIDPRMSTEDGDLVAMSFSDPLTRAFGLGMQKMISQNDKDMVDGLKKAGMAVRTDQDGCSILDHQLVKGGRFYIDQGAAGMILDGRLKIHFDPEGVTKFYNEGVVIGSNKKLEADVVVLATGYQRGTTSVEKLMGPEVAARVGILGKPDDERERTGWWRPTGWPGFWFMTGSFIWSRQFSGPLALQISAIERGFNTEHYK